MNDAPVYKEEYYSDVPITARIALVIAAIERSHTASITIGIASGVLIGIGLILFGYQIGYAVGVLSPWYELRGWIALLLFSIVGSVFMVNYSNRKKEH